MRQGAGRCPQRLLCCTAPPGTSAHLRCTFLSKKAPGSSHICPAHMPGSATQPLELNSLCFAQSSYPCAPNSTCRSVLSGF